MFYIFPGRGRRSLPNGDKIAHFYVSVPLGSSEIKVVGAQATFFKKGATENVNSTPETVLLSLYRIDDIKKFRPKQRTSVYKITEGTLLKTFNISSAGDEWLEVNVTEVVNKWLTNKNSDTGILIRCPNCASAGINIRTGGTSHVPTLHVQTRLLATKRVKRSREMRRASRARGRKLDDCKDGPMKSRHSYKCCRRSMKVRFADIPDFDFIVAPPEFDAYYCSGKCPPRFNPANEHALLQSLLNMQKINNVPKPCCTPTDLSGLHVLHVDNNGKLKTHKWDNVIVTECGCA